MVLSSEHGTEEIMKNYKLDVMKVIMDTENVCAYIHTDTHTHIYIHKYKHLYT